jgi:hypothetical protein
MVDATSVSDKVSNTFIYLDANKGYTDIPMSMGRCEHGIMDLSDRQHAEAKASGVRWTLCREVRISQEA